MSANDAMTQAVEALTAMTGRAPDGVWSSPGRVNLIGEHTDYNDGFVLPFAIDARTYVAIAPRTDTVLRVTSTFSPEPVEVAIADLVELVGSGPDDRVAGWARYPLGVAWAMLESVDAERVASLAGLDMAFASDVPVGAGLSSSAAIEGATAIALRDTWGLDADGKAMAIAGRKAENEAVGAPTGIMDQMASILGREGAATFLDCRTFETQSVDLGLEEAGLAVLVMDSGVEHAHADGGYRSRREACERAAATLGVDALRDVDADWLDNASGDLDGEAFLRARHVVTENARVLETVDVLRAEGAKGIGDLLTASHASMRDDFENSVPEIDTAVDAAIDAGALGARMTGGGFGGSAIALVPVRHLDAVRAGVEEACAGRGYKVPRMFTVEPSEGARRDL